MDIATTTPEQDIAVEREEALSCRFPPSPVFRRDTVRVTTVTAYMCRHAELPTRIELSLVKVEHDGRRRVIDRNVLVVAKPIHPAPWQLVVAPWIVSIGAAITLVGALRSVHYPLLVIGAAFAWLSGYFAHDLSSRRRLSPPP